MDFNYKKNIFKALSGFQKECPVIHKGQEGYNYSYTPLSEIIKAINPYLDKYKIGFTQLINKGVVQTIIFHTESGEFLESNTEIPQNVQLKGQNQFQVLGSGITYIKRYALSSALGIVTDKDVDAKGEKMNMFKDMEELSKIEASLKDVHSVTELTTLWNSLDEKQQGLYQNNFTNKKNELA